MHRFATALSLFALVAAGCASSGTASAPGTAGVSITSSGVAPASVSVVVSGRVTFTNNDTASHQIAADNTTACSFLSGPAMIHGTSWTASMSATVQTCTYHDQANPTLAAFKGSVVIAAAGGGGGPGGWIVGGGGLMAQAAPAGGFDTLPAQTGEDLLSIFCVEPSGFTVGTHGTVLHTVDDGASWQAESSGVTTSLRATAFANALRGIAVGDGATLLVTFDAGASWKPARVGSLLGSAVPLRAADFAEDGLHAWVVGDYGTILLSQDGGASFQRIASGTAADLDAVRFAADALHGFALGAGGLVLATADGGTSWSPLATAPATLKGLQVSADGSRIVAVGDFGLIWRSIDSGATWSEIPSGTGLDLDAVGFAP